MSLLYQTVPQRLPVLCLRAFQGRQEFSCYPALRYFVYAFESGVDYSRLLAMCVEHHSIPCTVQVVYW